MSGTSDTEFSVGDRYWCVDPFLTTPLPGTIVSLTAEPGKTIGLQFDEDIGSRLDCDGAGIRNRCLWTLPTQIYNQDEWEAQSQDLLTQAAARAAFKPETCDRIMIDGDGQVIVDDSDSTPLPQALEDDGPRMPAVKE